MFNLMILAAETNPFCGFFLPGLKRLTRPNEIKPPATLETQRYRLKDEMRRRTERKRLIALAPLSLMSLSEWQGEGEWTRLG